MRAAGPETRPSRSGKRGTTMTTCSWGCSVSALASARAALLRPEELVFDVHQSAGPRQRLEVGPRDAPLPLASERVERPLGGIGAQHLHGVSAERRRLGGPRWQWVGMAGLAGEHPDHAPHRVAVVERCRILPSLAERVGQRGHGGALDLRLHVVPRRVRTERVVELDRLGIALVAGVVVATVREIDAADEGDVVVAPAAAPDHEQLLVMAPSASHPLVEEDLAPRRVDEAGEREVRLLGEVQLRGVRTPQEPAHVHVACRARLEHGRQLGARSPEPLVRHALPVGEVQPVTRARMTRARRGGDRSRSHRPPAPRPGCPRSSPPLLGPWSMRAHPFPRSSAVRNQSSTPPMGRTYPNGPTRTPASAPVPGLAPCRRARPSPRAAHRGTRPRHRARRSNRGTDRGRRCS